MPNGGRCASLRLTDQLPPITLPRMLPYLTVRCLTCERTFQYGKNLYDGHYSKVYEAWFCKFCLRNNSEGWAPRYEDRILVHLKDIGLPVPKRNREGWLPIEF